jgi:hypothetical protein
MTYNDEDAQVDRLALLRLELEDPIVLADKGKLNESKRREVKKDRNEQVLVVFVS